MDEHLDQKLDSRFDGLSARIDALDSKLEKRTDGLHAEIKALGTKVDGLVNRLDDNFKRLVGINVTMWAATVAAMFVSMSILLTRLP